MKSFLKCVGALLAVAAWAASAAAGDAVSAGKVKAINSAKKEFVLSDAAGKDWTIKLGDGVVINRGGHESKSDLQTDDSVNVCYDKGTFTWTAHYILVLEGAGKSWELVNGTFKGYDADKRQFTFTDSAGKDSMFAMGDAKVRLNNEAGKVEDIKIGDKTLAIVEKTGDGTTLKCVMIDRK